MKTDAMKKGRQDVFHLHFHIVPRKQGDGQNIRWKTHPGWRKEVDAMLDKIALD